MKTNFTFMNMKSYTFFPWCNNLYNLPTVAGRIQLRAPRASLKIKSFALTHSRQRRAYFLMSLYSCQHRKVR
jgi:hypothetical protein